LPEPVRADLKAALSTDAKKRTPVEKYLVAKLGPLVATKDEEVLAAMNEPERAQLKKLEDQTRPLNEKKREYGHIQAVYDLESPPASYLFRRGAIESPAAEVEPGFLSILTEPGKPSDIPASATGAKTTGRRLALARWLTDPDTPAGGLVARVFVNRVWMNLFGEGIVPTVDNFGRSGLPPVNPELLDWLATDFIHSGWRIKPLIRLMMMSSAYRQASWRSPKENSTAAESIDPGNRLLWHARLRRLESEEIRDAVLATSGKLDLTMGGKPVPLDYGADGMVQVAKKDLPTPTSQWRRSLYLFTRRNYNLSFLVAFDQPMMSGNCPRRTASSVVLQSLAMLNDSFLIEQAEYFAKRLDAGSDLNSKISQAYRFALARKPSPKELAWSADLVERQTENYSAAGSTREEADLQSVVQLCRMLLNSNEFLYLE
jgi:hypothetical protein